jgi:hypothetical protein
MQVLGRYSVELCRQGGFGAGVEDVITSDDNLTQANGLYWHFVAANPGPVVLLCDGARVLARSNRLDAMTELAAN